MSKKDNGGPAFPNELAFSDRGMSLRDWFAGQALIGLIACPKKCMIGEDESMSSIAYQLADAMLAERAKE